MIHTESVSDIFSKRCIPLWLISAFKAGFINSAGFFITGKFVSHVTGFGTQVGIAIGHKDYFFGAELLMIPISFILGGVLTSFVLDRDYAKFETPPYWKVQTLITLLLAVVMFLGESGFTQMSGSFDSDANYNMIELVLISMLCFVCGLKNSLVTWSTSGKIRVTHLTGLSTDIGLNLIKTFRGGRGHTKEEARMNIVRILLVVFFSVGAMISAILYPLWGFKIFFIPLIISICMSVVSLIDGKVRLKKFGKQLVMSSIK